MNAIERKQLISDLATSPGFIQSMIACSKNIEGRQPSMQEVGLWFYTSGYMDCLDYQKQTRITRPYKTALREELNRVKSK